MAIHERVDLFTYANACHVVAVYENLVVDYARPAFQDKPSWFDSYVAVFDKVATDPLKWSNQIVPQFISVPQHVINSSTLVKSHFDTLDDDCKDLSRNPNDRDAIDDAISQLRSILNVVTTLMNDCRTLVNDLDQYSGMTAQVDHPVLLDGVKLSNDQMVENYRHIEYLHEEIGHLQAEIDALSHIPTPEAWAKVRECREKIQSDLQLLNSLQSDVIVLQGMNASIKGMQLQNQQVVSNFGAIRQQWGDFMDLLGNLQEQLNVTIEVLPTAFNFASAELNMAKVEWGNLLSMSRDLAGISYS
ncbi:hypothetical protein [Tumebacillus permanentifrigoris]|uniref:Uncharacterized protein n=1 Tax=Tumebacillus permanentifrigoris TaxID=378543 RepID=A0A316D800_9BACL|nr:hypothetical protein [Tumebacillus permanentifrigoris]PWK11267.1 hypothetical protein C7459_11160 [Tumebacillus permanentifrigoris]